MRKTWARFRGTKDLREDKSIPVDPVWVLRVESHEFVEQDVCGGSQAHRGARMAGVGFGGSINLYVLAFLSGKAGAMCCARAQAQPDKDWDGGVAKTYREDADGVDSLPIGVGVTHDGGEYQ